MAMADPGEWEKVAEARKATTALKQEDNVTLLGEVVAEARKATTVLKPLAISLPGASHRGIVV